MLKKKTCLLLGAGASQHLGFPLGFELRQKMLFELLAQKDKPRESLHEDFRSSGEDLGLFYERLAYGNWTSPDAFLEKHREFIKTGKYLMCRILAEHEDRWGITSRGGWYDKLVAAIHVDDPHTLKDNGLSVVTFNYDRSLDFRLHKYVENQFGIEATEAWQLLQHAIPIVHVHGTLGKYPDSTYGDKSNIFQRGQDIKIISEVADDTEEFRLASRLLNEAERVVVFGFGFATDNVKRLHFFNSTSNEDRDVVVAMGYSKGPAYDKDTQAWMAQWGLMCGKHFWYNPCTEFIEAILNPFG